MQPIGPGGAEDVVLFEKRDGKLGRVRSISGAHFVRLHGRHLLSVTFRTTLESVEQLARRQHRHRWVAKIGEVLISRDECVGCCGNCERNEVVVVGISGDRWNLVRIANENGPSCKRLDVHAGLIVSHEITELRAKEHVLELVEELRRGEQIELAVAPPVEELDGRPGLADDCGEEHARVEHDP